MKKLKIRIHQFKTLFLLYTFKIISMIPYNKKYWIICERGYDARDNGYHFYKYMKENHPEQKVYYIIDKNSADYRKVKDDAVQYGSIKNYFLVSTAEKIISTHYATMLPKLDKNLFKLTNISKKFYFLQHGIIKEDLKSLYYENSPMKLFVCGAYPEYLYVKENFGYPENIVQYTGLPRYDKLQDTSKKNQILIMPTWRYYIKNKIQFFNSDYYKNWSKLLNDKDLQHYLEEKNLKLVFYQHFEFQKYSNLFNIKNNNIIIASFHDYDVQRLLCDSSLLITDYSSVYFDFSYMKKPVIYYQFDQKEYHSKHYSEGYFNFKEDGFGPVLISYDEVIKNIKEYVQNDFHIEGNYIENINRFFKFRDFDNCKRVYDAIRER